MVDQGGACAGGCSGVQSTGTRTTIPLELSGGCTAMAYDLCQVVPLRINTLGPIGDTFEEVDCSRDLASLQLLILQSDRAVQLRFDPTRPTITTAAIPAGGITTGSATITVRDTAGLEFSAVATFNGTTNTPELVRAQINAALGGAGAPTPPGASPAVLNLDGTLTISSPGVGPLATVALVDGASGVLTDDSAVGTATDLPITVGTAQLSFDRSTAPSSVWISGSASAQLLLAGSAA